MTSDYSNHNTISWIFFAGNAKPTSMRRALAARLAERERVVIVDQPVSLLRDKKLPAFEKRSERLPGVNRAWYYRPLHFPERLPRLGKILKHLNQHRLQDELNQLLPKNGKRIVCYDSPTQDQIVGKLGEDLSVYVAIDDRTITVWGDPIPGEIEAEKRLLGKVDKVVCVSETLAQILSSRITTNKHVPIHILPNAYDERCFNPDKEYKEPSNLAGIPRPRILIAGHISERIDWEGVARSIKGRPNWSWVFVGPADAGMKERISNRLGNNGFYHPPISLQDVPAWIHHCDACAVPYRLNAFTLASHPLKAIEYLAMGAPVLSTRIPSLAHCDKAIEWVSEGEGPSYVKALDELLNKRSNRELRTFRHLIVAGESWEIRVPQFREIVIDAIP